MVSAFEDFTITKKLVHGNINLHTVFIKESPESGLLSALVDPSEFDGLTRLLKISQADVSEKPMKKAT